VKEISLRNFKNQRFKLQLSLDDSLFRILPRISPILSYFRSRVALDLGISDFQTCQLAGNATFRGHNLVQGIGYREIRYLHLAYV
jgi:hypothetical protein